MSSAPELDSYVPEMNSQGCADFLNHAALMLITIQKATAVTIVVLFQEKKKKNPQPSGYCTGQIQCMQILHYTVAYTLYGSLIMHPYTQSTDHIQQVLSEM